MMRGYFDRDGKPMTLEEWAAEMEKGVGEKVPGPRHVGYDEHDGWYVSTVWLGLDHNFDDGPPLIFETMVFGGEHDQETWRYPDENAAREGHHAVVSALREGREP